MPRSVQNRWQHAHRCLGTLRSEDLGNSPKEGNFKNSQCLLVYKTCSEDMIMLCMPLQVSAVTYMKQGNSTYLYAYTRDHKYSTGNWSWLCLAIIYKLKGEKGSKYWKYSQYKPSSSFLQNLHPYFTFYTLLEALLSL